MSPGDTCKSKLRTILTVELIKHVYPDKTYKDASKYKNKDLKNKDLKNNYRRDFRKFKENLNIFRKNKYLDKPENFEFESVRDYNTFVGIVMSDHNNTIKRFLIYYLYIDTTIDSKIRTVISNSQFDLIHNCVKLLRELKTNFNKNLPVEKIEEIIADILNYFNDQNALKMKEKLMAYLIPTSAESETHTRANNDLNALLQLDLSDLSLSINYDDLSNESTYDACLSQIEALLKKSKYINALKQISDVISEIENAQPV